MKAKLYTNGVDDMFYVATVEIPNFAVLPEVLIWGTRVFKFNPRVKDFNTYTEVFAYAITESP